ncbi:hypothetical protein AVEN_195144-1 [Araneus ventricosus]|uniref:Uncharacterized protein n=1 Tax=Araneus ventricosus TaxID=182803 RepID=A0A4Y2BG73_ARAVE|nr:hypothetical protein AVEN_195144-1 [Araneus ventricosus]
MLVNEREHNRELGYRRILKARQTVPKKKTVRNFVLPKINFQASDYIEIINWNYCVVYPPPMLRGLSEDDIKSLINKNHKIKSHYALQTHPDCGEVLQTCDRGLE